MIDDFPAPTEFIGLIRQDSDKIVCLEGHHRAVAVALAKRQGKEIDFKEGAFIALAELPATEISILDQILKRGTSKNPEN